MGRLAHFFDGFGGSDVHLKAQIDAGNEDPALHAEAARRGGLDYLNYHRSEWPKSPKDRDESKRV